MARRPVLLSGDPHAPFPDVSLALRQPDGLLAVGGDLSVPRLLAAYRSGIFPWYSEGQPILWWSPDPRTVFRTGAVHLSSRFRRELRRLRWQVRADTAFDAVVAACAAMPRPGQDGTWIVPGMRRAYAHLHRLGHAHSIEVFDEEGRLAGGIYGVAIGRNANSGGSSVSVGEGANASHTNAAAIGRGTATARNNSVAVGDRDIELQANGRGIITRSPDGTLYKISVANGGTLTVTPV